MFPIRGRSRGAFSFRRHSVALVLITQAILAAPAAGEVGGTFLTADHDARGLAMGGACISLARGDASVKWNPSRMPYQTMSSTTVGYGNVIEDFTSGLTTLSTSIPWGGKPADEYGLGLTARWAVGGLLSYFGLDDVGGSASWSETAVSGAVARTLWSYTSVGLAVKYLNVGSEIEGGNANGYSVDLAFSIDTTDRTRAALVARNLAGVLSWEEGRDERPARNVDIAFSYAHRDFAAAEMAFNLDADGVTTAAIGAEISLAQGGLLLWGGFKRVAGDEPRNIPSFGVGVPIATLTVGYGASFDHDEVFGTAQRLSISAAF